MSANFEAALVTAILDERNIRDVVKQKITNEFFSDTQIRAAYQYLLGWYQNPKYNEVPSWESFTHQFENFEPVRLEESLTALCDKVREQKLYSDIAASLQEIADLASGDPKASLDRMKQLTSFLTVAHTVDNSCTVRSRLEELKTEYYNMKSGATGLKGYAYPWPALNEATLGLQEQHLVFLYGRPKSGKTWIMLEIARCLHQMGLRILIFSQEISDLEMCRRFVALSTNVDYNQYLRGALPADVEAEFMQNLDCFLEQDDVIIDALESTGDACLIELGAKIDDVKPHVVLIDGLYFLGEDWKELAQLTRGLKRTTKHKKIPIIGTTQANRSRGKKGNDTDGADDFAYGDSFYQDADLAIRITSDIENKKAKEAKLFTAAVREGKATMFTINMKLATDLTQKAVMHFDEAENDIDEQIDQDKLDKDDDIRAEGMVNGATAA